MRGEYRLEVYRAGKETAKFFSTPQKAYAERQKARDNGLIAHVTRIRAETGAMDEEEAGMEALSGR